MTDLSPKDIEAAARAVSAGRIIDLEDRLSELRRSIDNLILLAVRRGPHCEAHAEVLCDVAYTIKDRWIAACDAYSEVTGQDLVGQTPALHT